MKRVFFTVTFVSLIFLCFTLLNCDPERRTQSCDPPCVEHVQRCEEGICRDLDCDPPCRDGRVCVRGFCQRSCDPENPTSCGFDETCCPHLRVCINTDSDVYNCGGCTIACPPVRANTCIEGFCGCLGWSSSPCPDGFGCCPDSDNPGEFICRDLLTDTNNCGSCDHSCGDLQCDMGECRCSTDEPCPEDEECCPTGCRNLDTDAQNCGLCGKTCEEGEDCCNGDCVNTLIDINNCGTCENTCAENQKCCIGECTDTETDPFNCGDCFVDCGAGGSCTNGDCD